MNILMSDRKATQGKQEFDVVQETEKHKTNIFRINPSLSKNSLVLKSTQSSVAEDVIY